MVITNEQSLYRAISETFVNRRSDVILLLNRYGYNVKSYSTEDVVPVLIDALSSNDNFVHEFSGIVAKEGYVNAGGSSYNNGIGDFFQSIFGGKKDGKNDLASSTASSAAAGAAGGGVVGAIAGAISGIFGFFGSKQESQNIEMQGQIDRENFLYELIKEQEAKKVRNQKTATTLTIVVLATLAIVTAAVIFKKRNK